MPPINAPRGVPDILPPASEDLEEVEGVARELFDRYGYRRAELPVFEHAEVFQRTAGETSEVVLEKQMYVFEDRRGRALALRPEGTAGTVRAFVQHDLAKRLPGPVRLFYVGPMFRYERPQRGRDRQFEHIGAECLGSAEPVIDAELIVMAVEFFRRLGLAPRLLLNSMGHPPDRERYWPVLREALADRMEDMCPDCHLRLEKNPLRIFDCKVAACRRILRRRGIPAISEFLCDECRCHYAAVQEILEALGVAWTDSPHLVRGFDYYTRTVFELEIESLGGRPTVCGGGRYDGLVEELGGPPTPACGFAIGVTPTLVSLEAMRPPRAWRPEVFIAWTEGLAAVAMGAATDLRRAGRRVTVADRARSFRSQLREAHRLGAERVLILGPNEVARGSARIKDMATGAEREVALGDVVRELR